MSIMHHGVRVAAAGVAVAFCGLAAAPAFAQRIEDATAAAPSIVLGQSPARSCYESAAARSASQAALDTCDLALARGLAAGDRAATHVNRAIVREQRDDLMGAVQDIEAAVAISPDLSQAYVNLGGVYVKLQRWSEAETALDRAIALAPDAYAEAHYLRAVAREEQGDVPGAYADYQAAAALSPEWTAPRDELKRFKIVADGGEGGA